MKYDELERITDKEHDRYGSFRYVFLDAEGDPITCYFNYDGCVEIDTRTYTYLTIGSIDLLRIQEVLEEAECIFDSEREEINNIIG